MKISTYSLEPDEYIIDSSSFGKEVVKIKIQDLKMSINGHLTMVIRLEKILLV